MRLLWAAALLASSLICVKAAAQILPPALTTHYVSPSGSDTWDGSAPTVPFRTLPYAIKAIRAQRSTGSEKTRARLVLMPGTYYLEKTLKLNGDKDSYLDIEADPSGEVVISGGQVVPSAPVPGTTMRTATFTGTCAEAFLGSRRLVKARSPNTPGGHNRPIAEGPWHTITDLLETTDTCKRNDFPFSQPGCPDSNKEGFVIDKELMADWKNLNQTQVIIFHSWTAEYATVAGVTTGPGGRQEVRFERPLVHYAVGTWPKSGGWRFLVLNNMELLDQEGEMVCLQEGDQARLTYIPPAGLEGEDPVVTVLPIVLELSWVTHVTLTGLKFQHSSSKGWDGYNFGNRAAVKVIKGEDISLDSCEFSQIGTIGLFMQSVQGAAVHRCSFSDVGYHGMMARFPRDGEANTDILVDSNSFDGCGITNYWQPNGIWIEGEQNIIVSHNELTNIPNHAIKVTGPMDWGADYQGDKVFHVENNYIHDVGGILNDFGAIFVSVGALKPFFCNNANLTELKRDCYTHAHIYNNWIENVDAYFNGAMHIYTDASSSGTVIENNVLRGRGMEALYHHCGLDNESVNNIIHRTNDTHSFHKLTASCEKNNKKMQRYTNHHNIYLLDSLTGNINLARNHDRFYDETPVFHHNLYWSHETSDMAGLIFPEKKDWAAWTSGNDRNDINSTWTTVPVFRNPGEGDYTLVAGSPAGGLGIRQIDTSTKGPRP